MLSISRLTVVAVLAVVVQLGTARAESTGAPEAVNGSLLSLEASLPQASVQVLAQAAATGADAAPAVDAGAVAANGTSSSMSLEFEQKPEGEMDLFDQPMFNEYVTLDFKNADIQNVIRLIAAKTGLNILLDPSEVEGQITLHLENVRLGNALDNILRVRKLAYIMEKGNIVRIVPESRVGRTEVETQTDIIELNWRNASDMEETFQKFLSSHGSIKANEESQTLIITDVPPTIAKIKELIRGIDRPDRQVVIEARLVDVQVGAMKNLSTNWSFAKVNEQQARDGAPGLLRSFVGPPTLSPDGSIENATFQDIVSNTAQLGNEGTIGGVLPVLIEGLGFTRGVGQLQFGSKVGIFGDTFDLNAQLNALETRNVVEVLANPRVTTLNNVPAKIDIIQRVPYIQGVVAGPGGNTVQTVEFEDVGETVDVKPIITPDKHVRLDIKLLQRIFRARVGSSALDPPLIDVRRADSTVIVMNNNTVVLGGLRRRQGIDTVNGVPWLHRVPLIGWAFKNKNYDQSRAELVLMITPNIVEEALLTDHEKEMYDRIDVKWHVPDYYSDESRTEDDLPLEDMNCKPPIKG